MNFEEVCNTISVRKIIATDDVVAVEVDAVVDGFNFYSAKGVARRDAADEPNVSIGLKLALGRAIRQLGRDILHDGHLDVYFADKALESQRQASEEGRARKAKRVAAAKKATKKATPVKKAAKKVAAKSK
jgi:hypothetical protein